MELSLNNLKWNKIHWKRAQLRLTKLQRTIYKLSAQGEKSKVHAYQGIVLNSSSAKLIAVRMVTQDNRGKKTPGVDGISSVTIPQRSAMAKALQLDGKASPIRRVYIPKPGKSESRPLGIPTLQDRAKQTLAKLALEPEWEAKFEPNSYGFRPGRSCHDAIEAIFKSINKSPQGKYVLDADIAKCFDTIDHGKLISKLHTTPKLRRQIESWLKAGILNKLDLEPSHMGTPQGGVISPFLSNVALHGLEDHLKSWIGQKRVVGKHGRSLSTIQKQSGLNVIRYADDLVVLHKDKEIVVEGQKVVAEWLLQNAGLKLSEIKTKLAHTDESVQGQAGFEFLGFSVRRYAMSKYAGNKFGTGMKTLIKPSRESLQRHKLAIQGVLEENSKATLIVAKLNPIIRGWCNYFRTVTSSAAFSTLRLYTYEKLIAWAKRKHPTRGHSYVYRKYFTRVKNALAFGCLSEKDGSNQVITVKYHNVYSIKRHIKVQGNRSPFDGDDIYWSQRLRQYAGTSPRVSELLKRQKGRCKLCDLTFSVTDVLEVDHIVPLSRGGKDYTNNLQLLHAHCHDQKKKKPSNT